MPEGVGYGPQFTASVGKTLNYIGKHIYAFSGALAFDDNGTTLLEFTTGGQYIIATLNPYRTDNDSLDSQHRISLDGQLVGAFGMSSGSSSSPEGPPVLLFPPYTQVSIILINVQNTSAGNGGISITGSLYGKVD